MSRDLVVTEYSKLSEQSKLEIEKVLFDKCDSILKVGQYVIDDRSILRISDIRWATVTRHNDKTNKMEEVQEIHVDLDRRYDDGTWNSYGTYNEHRISSLAVWTGTLEELEEAVKADLENLWEGTDEEEEEDTSTSLSTLDGAQFRATKADLIIQSNNMQARVNYTKQIMDIKRRELEAIVSKMNKQVKKLTTIIWTIELYMGLKENIELIQDGPEASDDTPIHLLQELLFMDEEVGDPTNGGLDFSSMDQFIKWLTTHSEYYGYQNFKLLVPYEKSVRIMRVRREKKNYSTNPFINWHMNMPNFRTFILIRNGEKLYCIRTDMQFGPRLFPGTSELNDLYIKLSEDSWKDDERVVEEMDDEVQKYKRNLIIMQGLVDRTEVFGKVFGHINFLDGSSINKGKVVLIYDCDKTSFIGDGRFTFKEWWTETNKEIEVGSRIILDLHKAGHWRDYYPKEDRFFRMYQGSNIYDREHKHYPNYPDNLDEPVQLVSCKVKSWSGEEKDQLFFKFLPSDTVWSEREFNYVTRKNKVSFAVFSEDTKINFDVVSHREIEWLKTMMHDRRVRKDYANSMRFLVKLVNAKEAEMKAEEPFCNLVVGQTGCTKEEALDLLHWWKTKNKYKRALSEDDAKALRMIVKKYKSKGDQDWKRESRIK